MFYIHQLKTTDKQQRKLPWFQLFQKPVPNVPVYGPFGSSPFENSFPPQTTLLHPQPTLVPPGLTSSFGRTEIIKVLEEYNMTHRWTRNLSPYWLILGLWPIWPPCLAPFPQHHFWIVLSMLSLKSILFKKPFLIWQKEVVSDTYIHLPVWTHLPWVYSHQICIFMLESQFCH